MGARRNADADTVGLELLRARKARHRQLGLGERQRGEVGIVAHVGNDAGHDGGLARLVFADRGVLGQHMRHLVPQHRRQFRGVAGQRDQAARHVKLAGRQRERVHRARIEDRHLVGLIGTIGGRDQPVDRLADQGFQLRIVIGAAIGGQDALMLALGGRAFARPCVPACWGAWGRRRGGLKPADIATAGQAQTRRTAHRRSPMAPARPGPRAVPRTLPRRPRICLANLILAKQFNLPHPEHLNSRPAARLDPAADPNSSIFEGLKRDSGGLESRHHAP